MRPNALAVLILVTGLLAACGTVPVSSLAALSRINAQTTDLAALRVALRLPDAIRPLPRGVNLDVLAKVSGEPDRRVTYNLVQASDRADMAGLRPPTAGTAVYVFRFSPEDAVRFDTFRASILAQRQLGKSGSIAVGVAMREFCLMSALPSGPILTTTYLRTSETGGFVEATRNLDLRQYPELTTEIDKLAPCPPM